MQDGLGVPDQGCDGLRSHHIPESYSAVRASRGHQPAIRGKRGDKSCRGVFREHNVLLPLAHIPDTNRLIVAHGSKLAPIGRKRGIGHPGGVPRQGAHHTIRSGVPKHDVVLAARDEELSIG
jgi:hypothetical protein